MLVSITPSHTKSGTQNVCRLFPSPSPAPSNCIIEVGLSQRRSIADGRKKHPKEDNNIQLESRGGELEEEVNNEDSTKINEKQ